MELLNEPDPIWGQTAQVYRSNRDDRYVKSNRAGNFIAPEGFNGFIADWTPGEKAKLCSWILDQNIAGETPEFTAVNLRLARSKNSLSINQKIDRFLMMLLRDGFRPGDPLAWSGKLSYDPANLKSMHRTMLWIEAVSDSEFFAFLPVLEQAEIVSVSPMNGSVSLAYGGFQRIERLDSGKGAGNQAFVAMWFDPTLQSAFDEGFAPAVIDAGFVPRRIDQKEHNNKVDDEIVAEIRRSKFVVADFTAGTGVFDGSQVHIARGGVYYEAGFAQGLGLPVIWTVRSDQIGMVHFDTRQFNHIVWESPAELRTRLFNRIAATIGSGTIA